MCFCCISLRSFNRFRILHRSRSALLPLSLVRRIIQLLTESFRTGLRPLYSPIRAECDSKRPFLVPIRRPRLRLAAPATCAHPLQLIHLVVPSNKAIVELLTSSAETARIREDMPALDGIVPQQNEHLGQAPRRPRRRLDRQSSHKRLLLRSVFFRRSTCTITHLSCTLPAISPFCVSAALYCNRVEKRRRRFCEMDVTKSFNDAQQSSRIQVLQKQKVEFCNISRNLNYSMKRIEEI